MHVMIEKKMLLLEEHLLIQKPPALAYRFCVIYLKHCYYRI